MVNCVKNYLKVNQMICTNPKLGDHVNIRIKLNNQSSNIT